MQHKNNSNLVIFTFYNVSFKQTLKPQIYHQLVGLDSEQKFSEKMERNFSHRTGVKN